MEDLAYSKRCEAQHEAGNLLDLVLTDLAEARVQTLPRVADHNLLLVDVPLAVPCTSTAKRKVWLWSKARWEDLKEGVLRIYCEEELQQGTVSQAAQSFTKKLLDTTAANVPTKLVQEARGTHPWVNDKLLELVTERRAAEGTKNEKDAVLACSQGFLDEFQKYELRCKEELKALKPGSRAWWRRSRELLDKKTGTQGVPALKKPGGEWLRHAQDKAEHFADTFEGKFVLPAAVTNLYSEVRQETLELLPPTLDWNLLYSAVLEALKNLREDSATGPDLLPTRLLKTCAEELATPVTTVVQRILLEGEWPDTWREHWILPLYKKKAVWNVQNYRGVHLTSQLSKVAERVVKTLLEPYLEKPPLAQGPFQFAYRKERGARDALLFAVCSWLLAFNSRLKVALYCADVAGAFDRVDAARLEEKLRGLGLSTFLVKTLASWLKPRRAQVVLEGVHSRVLKLANMVFQGTVLGPPLWNAFYADCRRAVEACGFQDLFFADDLNCWKTYPSHTLNSLLLEAAKKCQNEVHT